MMAHAGTGAEARLVIRIESGDRTAEEELVARYQRGVAVIVGRGATDPSAIDDVCQETFRLAIEKIRAGEVRDPDRLSGFICGLARCLLIEHFRRSSRAKTIAEPPSAGPPEQLDRLLLREQEQFVRKVLTELPSDRDREILYRVYIAEEDKDRICRDLGLSSVHFNRVIHRARERFRKLYEKLSG